MLPYPGCPHDLKSIRLMMQISAPPDTMGAEVSSTVPVKANYCRLCWQLFLDVNDYLAQLNLYSKRSKPHLPVLT